MEETAHSQKGCTPPTHTRLRDEQKERQRKSLKSMGREMGEEGKGTQQNPELSARPTRRGKVVREVWGGRKEVGGKAEQRRLLLTTATAMRARRRQRSSVQSVPVLFSARRRAGLPAACCPVPPCLKRLQCKMQGRRMRYGGRKQAGGGGSAEMDGHAWREDPVLSS